LQQKGVKMSKRQEKLRQKIKNYHKKSPVRSKKQERQVKRKVQNMRRIMREQNERAMEIHGEWVDNYLEQQRIIREVEGA